MAQLTETMTPRERWNAALHMQPVDRLPFWPKIGGSYFPAQPEPFRSMDGKQLHEWIGSDPHEWIGGCVKEVRKNSGYRETVDGAVKRAVYVTPHGELTAASRFDVPSQAWHPTESPVKTLDDVGRMRAWYDDCTLELDTDALEESLAAEKRIGNSGVVGACIGESPLMSFVEYLAGIENAQYLLIDHREEVEALFDAMHRDLVRRTQILCEHLPADIFYMIENTSTTLISPDQYRTYCFRHLMEYAQIARSFGRSMVLHMCGHLKKVLPDLAKLPVAGFEAFTSPTLGNTTLLDGRTACPNTCLIGGTNAMLWLRPASEIIAQIERDLRALPHQRGIVVTSAGIMPPLCAAETIKAVCEWVKEWEPRQLCSPLICQMSPWSRRN